MLENVKKHDNIITYERKLKIMSNTKKQGQGANNQATPNSWKQKAENFVKDKILEIIVGVMVAAIGWTIHDLPDSVNNLENRVTSMESKMEIIEGNYETLNSQIWSINRANSNEKESFESEPEILVASMYFSAGMISAQTSEKDDSDNVFVDMKSIQNEESIGVNIHTNEDATKKSMENLPFIMQYVENGEDVFFYGKYNEYGQWDGECIINRYRNAKLTSIMEATYNNGELKKYENIFKGTNFQNQEIWYVSNRVVEGDKSVGETITYFFYGDYEQRFDNETIKKEDMLSVDDFIDTIPSTMEGYYNGYVASGRYNDESGNAYLIKYKPDGTVRFLYKGNIVNGYPHDNTGNAWSVSLGYANDGYYYYKGIFTNGNHGKAPRNWKPMTQEEISEKVNPDDFKCPLTGLIEDNPSLLSKF
ncbi:MAG: hypothetical protein K2N15_10820 [Lachnospiraceae bacterium]|nr:hypothetical protein [Lachnospiraceae bacterium]